MMDLAQAIVLGIVQGITEFVPISSSGHLVLIPAAAGWTRAGLAFDTVLHLGTLVAIIAFFGHDWRHLAVAWLRSIRDRRIERPEAKLAWLIAIGSIPAAVLGLALESRVAEVFDQPGYVGYFLLVTAGLLAISERLGRRGCDLADITVIGCVVIGLFQGLALLPGISRSGATIAGAMLVGLARPSAARFSFLLATPIIFGAGLLQVVQIAKEPDANPEIQVLAAGFLAAAITGYFSIDLLLRYLRSGSLYPFAAYCVIVGAGAILLW